MKTAISIPDPVYHAADALAQRLGVSRSKLYASAIARYVADHRDADVTQRLDDVYASEPSAVDAALRAMQSRSLSESEW